MKSSAQETAKPDKELIIEQLLESLPPVMARNEVSRFLGGLVSASTLSKEDSLGTGPIAFRLGSQTQAGAVSERGKVFYRTTDLVGWIFDKWGVTRLVNINRALADGQRASS